MFWIGRPSIKLLLRPMTTTTKPFVIGPQLSRSSIAFMIRSLESDCWTVKVFVTIIILIPPLCHQMVCECEKDLSSLFFSQGRWTGSKSETGGIRFGIEQHQLLSETRFLRSCPRRFIRGIRTTWFFSRSSFLRNSLSVQINTTLVLALSRLLRLKIWELLHQGTDVQLPIMQYKI